MASKLSSIDYKKRAKGQSKREYAAQVLGGKLDYKSKRGKGQSRREYAAQVLGGKLDYKTGTISVPSKKSTSKTSSSAPKYSSVNDVYAKEGYMISPEHAEYLYKNQQTYTPKNTAWEASPEREAQKKSQSQREQASNVYKTNKFADQKNSQAKGSSRTTSSIWRGLLGAGLTASKSAVPFVGATTNLANTLGYDLTDFLGIPRGNAMEFNLDPTQSEQFYTGTMNPERSVTDSTIGETQVNPFDEAINNNPNPSGESFANTYIKKDSDDNRRTSSRPVSNPIFQPTQTSSLSDILNGGSPQSAPIEQPGQSIDKTRQLYGGRGYFSTGEFANGKGGSGIEGTLTGTSDDENSWLNLLNPLYTPEAKAAETSLFSQPQTYGFSGMGNQGYGQYNEDGSFIPASQLQMGGSDSEVETPTYPRTGGATGGSTGGGVAQQYSQQGKNPQQQYYEEAIKNAKKVMNETIKALKKQYAESERTGTDALNKQKAEDLQALSARFSFGLNQDPNSEQAIQYSQRMQNDYAGKLADFLKQLSTAKNQDISSAKQNYYSQKSSAQEKLAQLMASLEEARINSANKLSSAGNTAESKKQAAIMKLLNQAANMPSGGREYAQQIANIQGLGDISGYTPNGWENAYNPNFGKTGYAPSGEVQKIMNELGVDEATAQKLIIQEMNNDY